MDPSPAVESRVRSEIETLNQRFDRINTCRVVIEAPHHHRQHGREIQVKIDLGVPGSHILVNHEPSVHNALAQSEEGKSTKRSEAQPDHKDIYVSIRDAFAAARRQLDGHREQMRNKEGGPRISDKLETP